MNGSAPHQTLFEAKAKSGLTFEEIAKAMGRSVHALEL